MYKNSENQVFFVLLKIEIRACRKTLHLLSLYIATYIYILCRYMYVYEFNSAIYSVLGIWSLGFLWCYFSWNILKVKQFCITFRSMWIKFYFINTKTKWKKKNIVHRNKILLCYILWYSIMIPRYMSGIIESDRQLFYIMTQMILLLLLFSKWYLQCYFVYMYVCI